MRGQKLLVALVLVALATAPVAAQSQAASLTVTADEATPGETVTLTFEFENTGEEPTATVVSVTELPDDWTIQSHADDGGMWRDDPSWLFEPIEAGGTVAPSITVAVPADASGSVTVAGNATIGDGFVTDQTTVTVAQGSPTDGSGQATPTDGAGQTTPTETSDGEGPGFGVVAALVATLALGRRLGRAA